MENDTQTDSDVTMRPLGEMDKDEEMVCVIKRHPAGIIYVYLLVAGGLLGAMLLAGLLVPALFSSGSTAAILAALALFGAAAIAVVFLLVATLIYFQSRLLVTNKNLTQILQRSLFNKKVSQLSMANVEDVSALQKGLLATAFNYGTLTIETAGEQANFIFEYCPNPRLIAKMILEAREHFIEDYPEVAKRANEKLKLPGYLR